MNYFKDKISETLLIPLICKAQETQRIDAIIKDDMAYDIIQKLEIDTKKYSNKTMSRIGTAIRTKYFDKTTKDFIIKNHSPVIITLGCGLDTRYHRLPEEITRKAFFYYLDLDDVMRLREELLPENHNEKYLSGSILNDQWIVALKKEITPDSQLLFLIEGVVMYFDEKEISLFFKNLCLHFQNGMIVFDVLNKWLSSKSADHDTLKMTNATFKFGFDDDHLPTHWHENLLYRSTTLFTDYPEYKRMGFPINLLMTYIKKYKYAARILTYEIKSQ